MTHDEMISVIQAHKEGKKVEFKHKTRHNEWFKGNDLGWNFQEYNYRIAREPRKCWVKWLGDGLVEVVPCDGKNAVVQNSGYQLVTEQL